MLVLTGDARSAALTWLGDGSSFGVTWPFPNRRHPIWAHVKRPGHTWEDSFLSTLKQFPVGSCRVEVVGTDGESTWYDQPHDVWVYDLREFVFRRLRFARYRVVSCYIYPASASSVAGGTTLPALTRPEEVRLIVADKYLFEWRRGQSREHLAGPLPPSP